MRANDTERQMRALFQSLVAHDQIDAAAGVYMAVRALYLPTTAWHAPAAVVRRTVELKAQGVHA